MTDHFATCVSRFSADAMQQMPLLLHNGFSTQGAHHKLLSVDTLQCKAAIEEALHQARHVSVGTMELLKCTEAYSAHRSLHFPQYSATKHRLQQDSKNGCSMIVRAGAQQGSWSTARCSLCLRGQTCRLRRSSLASLFVRYSSTRVVARRASCSAVSSLGSSTAGAGGAGATGGAAEGAAGSLAGDGVLHGATNERLTLNTGCHSGLTEERWH